MERTVDHQCDNTIDIFNNSPTTHIVNNMSNNFNVLKTYIVLRVLQRLQLVPLTHAV